MTRLISLVAAVVMTVVASVCRAHPAEGVMKRLLLAGVAGIALTTGAPAQAETVNQMIDLMRTLNDSCRGRNVGCAERDHLYERLVAAGMCWGRPGEIEAVKTWRRCRS
jgi:hypothetical protein